MLLKIIYFVICISFLPLLAAPDLAVLDNNDDMTATLALCAEHIEAGRLITGRTGTAYACYHEILGQYPHDPAALAGIKIIEQTYAKWAWAALKDKNLINSKKYIHRLTLTNRQSNLLADLQQTYNKTFPASKIIIDQLPNPPLYDQINGDVGDLKIEISGLKQQFIDIEKALDKKIITDTQALALTEVKQRFERLQQEFYSIKDPGQVYYAVIITLWQQLKHTESLLIETQAKINKNGHINSVLSKKAQNLTTKQQQHDVKIKTLTTDNQTLKTDNIKLKQQYEKNLSLLKTLKQQKIELSAINDQRQYQYYESQKALHAEKKHNITFQAQVKQLNKSLIAAHKRIAATCHIDLLGACDNKASCTGVGGIWELEMCSDQANCRNDNLQGCQTKQLCLKINGIWSEKRKCHYPMPCSQDKLLTCSNKMSCVKAGGRWRNSCLPSELIK